MAAPLYNRAILALAVENSEYPALQNASLSGMLRSTLCGSKVSLDMEIGPDRRIAELGMKVEACALGQASATLFARHAAGRTHDDLRAGRDQLAAWLRGEDETPAWPEFAALAAVKDYPARHAAILLPFDVAVMLTDGTAA